MEKSSETLTLFSKFSPVIIGGFLAIFISTVSAATLATDKNNSKEVKEARELLDSWNGQTPLLEQAQNILARVLKANPQNYLALMEMARYQAKAGYISSHTMRYDRHEFFISDYSPGTIEQAESTIKRAISINPRFADGYVYLAQLQINQVKLDDAKKYLIQAESIGTDDPWLHLTWAQLDYALGEYSATIEQAQRVLQSGTANIQAQTAAYAHLIESHKQLGNNEKVVSLYKEQIKRNPTNPWIRGEYADYLSSRLGRHEEAISQAISALKLMNYGRGQEVLALSLYRQWADLVAQGKDVEAEKYFKAANGILPQLGQVMVWGTAVPKGEPLAKALIKNKGVSIDALSDSGSTALLNAALENQVQAVKFLLNLKANPNFQRRDGWTPLIAAAEEGNNEIVEMLLAAGADTHAMVQGHDAAAYAENRGYADTVKLLRSGKHIMTPSSSVSNTASPHNSPTVTAEVPCIYKAVMTDEEIENCKKR